MEDKQKEIKQKEFSETDETGITRYYNSEHQLHRDDGPAVVSKDEKHLEWWINGERHRDDGPAVIDIENNVKEWWLHNQKIEHETFVCNNKDVLSFEDIDGSNPELIFIKKGEVYYCFTVDEIQKYIYYVPVVNNPEEFYERTDFPYVIQEAKNNIVKQYNIKEWIYKIPYAEIFVQSNFLELLDQGYYIFNIDKDDFKNVILFRTPGSVVSGVHDYPAEVYSIQGVKKTNIRPLYYFSIGYALHMYEIEHRPKIDNYNMFYNKIVDGLLDMKTPDSIYYHIILKTERYGVTNKYIDMLKENWKQNRHALSLYELIDNLYNKNRNIECNIYCKIFLNLPNFHITKYIENSKLIQTVDEYKKQVKRIMDITSFYFANKQEEIYNRALILEEKGDEEFKKVARELYFENWVKNNHSNSLNNYAIMLLEGIGGEKNLVDARLLFWKNWEEHNHLGSLDNYIYMLRNGIGGEKNEEEADRLSINLNS